MLTRFLTFVLVGAVGLTVTAGAATASRSHGRGHHPSRLATSADQVVLRRGEPVEIAAVLDRSTSVGTTFTQGISNAIRMAVQLTPASEASRFR